MVGWGILREQLAQIQDKQNYGNHGSLLFVGFQCFPNSRTVAVVLNMCTLPQNLLCD